MITGYHSLKDEFKSQPKPTCTTCAKFCPELSALCQIPCQEDLCRHHYHQLES